MQARIATPSLACARRPTLADRIGTWSSGVYARSMDQAKWASSSVVRRFWAVSCTSSVTCTRSPDLALYGARKISRGIRTRLFVGNLFRYIEWSEDWIPQNLYTINRHCFELEFMTRLPKRI